MAPHASWQSRKSAVVEARSFVRDNSFATLSTINQGSHEFSGFPSGQIEYYSDMGDADASLLLIRVDMSSAFRNISLGSPASLAIRTGDAARAYSPLHMAANHRIILYGEFENYEPTAVETRRFFKLHPDARDWEPGSLGFHKTYWTRFVISGIYYIGGFGGEHYIGKLPVDQYKDVDSADEKSLNESESSSFLGWLASWIW